MKRGSITLDKSGTDKLITVCVFCQVSLSSALKKVNACEVVDQVEPVADDMASKRNTFH